MSQKVRKTLIMIVMAALIICLMAASLTYTFTYGRYAGGKFDEESPYEDLIEFVGAREYTVRSPEELIQAIEDGYSNIKIADDAEEPFVITEGVTDVTANLVLNLNGKVVVRNSRNPMLDVQTNVSVVLVYDSKNTGAFYNPVGSSLMASGGSLTVGSGGYESGPRAKEFQGKESAGTLSPQPSDVAIFTRGGITSPDNVDRANPNQLSYQKIEASSGLVPKTTGRYYRETADSGYDLVPADTFLVYTIEEDCFICKDETSCGVTFTKDQLYVNAEKTEDGETTTVSASEFIPPVCDVASCDFYYYYPISGTPGTANSPQDYAVIYGYWDVMKLAQDDKKNEADEKGMATALKEKGLIWPYASVRMEEGEGIVRGGTFSNHFDAVNTYGIYAEGGTLSVSKNTTVETTFTTGGEGVCIRVQSAKKDAEADAGEDVAATGGSLTISGGEFSSEKGNTIEMSGGNMTVTAGTFTKSAARSDGNDQIANQTAIIDIQGGTLKIEGNSADSVKLTAEGTVTDNGGTDNGGTLENVFGIRAEGGTVTTSGCTFNISGDYSAGVLSYNGEINLGDDTSITVTQSETATVLTSAGVSSEQASGDGEHPVNLSGDVTITSNGLGITARGTVNVTGGVSTVTTSRGTGIYVNNGSFTVGSEAAITVNSTVKSGYSWANPPGNTATNTPNIYNGVYVQGGSLISNGKLNVTFTGVQNAAFNTETQEGKVNTSYLNQQIKSYAVRVDNGNATITSGKIKNSVGGGVLVNGGTVMLGAENAANADLTVSTSGGESDGQNHFVTTDNQWQYDWTLTGGHAVAVEGGTLNIYSGTYTAQMGNGILVRNLASDSTQNTVTVTDGIFEGYNGTGRRVGPGAFYALKVMGGPLTLNINGGTFGKALENGVAPSTNGGAFVMGNPDAKKRATVNVTNASFNSYTSDTFAVFRYVDVTFQETSDVDQISMTVTKASTDTNNYAAIGVQNDFVYNNNNDHPNRGSTITIEDGTYSGGFGIWYGSPMDKVNISGGEITGTSDGILYSASGAVESSLSISGGMITGNIGLNLAEAPAASSAVTISGGTIKGYQDGILYSKSVAIDGDGYGLTIKGGTITGTGSENNHAHALKIDVAPQRHSILIENGVTLDGGRDAIYVSQSGGEQEAVSITGGTIQGGTASSGGCALWFADNIDSGVFVISGGTFTSNQGGAINANNPGRVSTKDILASGAYCFTDTPDQGTAANLAIYNRTGYFWDYSYSQVGGSGNNAIIDLNTTVYDGNHNSIGQFNEISRIVVSSAYGQQ